MKKESLVDLIAAIFILLFSYTAVSKFLDYERFVFQMKLAPIPLMSALAPLLGIITPVIESLIVLLLLFRRTRALGIYTSLFLIIIFEVYVVGMLASGKNLPCSCGGIISTLSWKAHIGFNAIFIFIGLAAVFLMKSKQNISPNTKKNFTQIGRAHV